jgi:hypothetical protein
MVIDVTPPTGIVVTVPGAPVQVTNATNVTISLTLGKPAKAGTTPHLTFTPPIGSASVVTLSGGGVNWTGVFQLTPAMGSGFGAFALSVSDDLGNLGQLITSGAFLEIYNTAKPSPPGPPTIFLVATVPGGGVKLGWTTVSNAEIYRVYSSPGTNGTPTNLVVDGLTDTLITNVPPADGYYLYAVTASRRGSEGTNSNVIVGISDRTPPPAPVNLTAQLAATGVDLGWSRGAGDPAFFYHVYRNGALIQTINGSLATNFATVDSPPRGTIIYTIGAVDSIGNEALSAPATIQLLVGAVSQFTVLANQGQAPYLTWTSDDSTVVGFNVYREGIKQNPSPVPSPGYLDTLGIPALGKVTYTVRAVNATNAESAPRTVTAYSVGLGLGVNMANGTNQALIERYFDDYRVSVSNLTSAAAIPIDHVELARTISGVGTLTLSNVQSATIGAGNFLQEDMVFPGAQVLAPQSVMVRAVQQPDLGGSTVIYQMPFDFANVTAPDVQIDVAADQPPLAGGLAALDLRVYNRGYAPMDLLVARNGGADTGDLGISLINQFGQEVGQADYKAVPPGAFFAGDGRVFVRVPPHQSVALQVTNILIPESLGTNGLFFQAVFANIYYDLGGPNQVASGPISGGMVSSLAVTPYFGTAKTDHPFYANDDPVLITGQAIDRKTQQPVPNVPLKIGFAISGGKFYQDVTTDGSGNYSFSYDPPQGLSGILKIWAAHPDVFDILNQAQISIYRVYMTPATGDLRMSKNDFLDFRVGMINPGDGTLTGFTLDFNAFKVVGTNQTAITNITVTGDLPAGFVFGPRGGQTIHYHMTAAADAPDNALVKIRMRSAEGAVAEFDANVTLLPAEPLLTVVDPSVGYAEVSVNRGDFVSKTVTVVNRGLRDLSGVTLQPPTNAWITVNQALGADGKVHLPDMPVGATNQFTVVFAPPTNVDLAFFNDQIVIAGTNATANFPVGVYALVTSSVKGNAKFYVDDILVEPVPGATVRIKNTLINEEYVSQTDVNGFVTITNLQEGTWSWQASAPGHSVTVGTVDIVGDQTVMVDTRLSKSLVTVNFTVVPVPFTDTYQITIEQTFETHVPAPVLVLTPPNMDFQNVGPGYDATFLVTAKNFGLIQMTDLTIKGMVGAKGGTLTPLITYVPLLAAQQSVVIPFRFTYLVGAANGATNGAGSGGGLADAGLSKLSAHGASMVGKKSFDSAGFADCASGGLLSLKDFFDGLMAIANANAECVDLRAAMAIAASLAVTYALLCAPSFSPLGFLPTPCPSGNTLTWLLSFLINAASCYCQNTSGGCFGGDNGGGGPNNGGGPTEPVNTGYGGGGPACFVAGTQVTLADGRTKPIEQVRPNDIVKTGWRPEDRAAVGSVESHWVNGTFRIQFAGGTLQASSEHLIWVDGHGWTEARNIHLGDWLLARAGERVKVSGITREHHSTLVYTFTNVGDHALLANGILVHDQCGLPAQLASAKPEQKH